MKIAFVTETFLPSVDGVVTRMLHSIDWLAAQGHDITVICPDLGPVDYAGCEVAGVKAIRWPIYRSRPWGTFSPEVGRVLERVQPDIVHAWHPTIVGTMGVYYAKKLGIPLITSYHTDVIGYLAYYGLMRIFTRPLTYYMRWLNNHAPITLATSNAMRARLERASITGVRVLPRGVDLSSRDPRFDSEQMRTRLCGGNPSRPLLVFIGRLGTEKNVESLLPLMKAHPEWSLAVVGDGPNREHLEHLFEGTPTVFTGFLQGEELSSAFASADVFVFPSTTETLGLVILEAMASGVPIVAAASPATNEQIQSGKNGLVYDPADPTSLQRNLEELLSHPELAQQLRAAGLADAASCSWEAASAALLDAYEDTIALYQAGWRCPEHPGRLPVTESVSS